MGNQVFRSGRIGSAFVFVCGCLAGVCAFAEDRADLFSMDLQQVLNIDVATASKLGLRANQSPGNLTIITSDQIKRYGYRTIGESLERVVGFKRQTTAASETVGTRGIAPRGLSLNARLLILIDGQRYNDFDSDGASLDDDFPLDIESVERIEVLKADGSAVWGSNALYGIVNIISKSSSSLRASQALFEYRSDERYKGYSAWSAETDGGLKTFGSASYTRNRGDISAYYPGIEGEDPTQLFQGESSGDLSTLHTNFKMEYDDIYATLVFGQNNRKHDNDVLASPQLAGRPLVKSEPFRAEVGGNFDVNSANSGRLTTRIFYSQDDLATFSQIPFDTVVSTGRTRNRQRTSGAEVRYTQNLTPQLRAVTGFEFVRTFHGQETSDFRQTDQDGTELSSGEFRQNYDRTSQSGLFDLVYSPYESVDVFLGGRFDKVSNFDGVVSMRSALVARPDSTTTLRLVGSLGQRNPALAEARANVGTEGEKLDNESLESFELSVDKQFSATGRVRASIFHSDLSDIIGLNPDPDDLRIYSNLAGFESSGFELDATYELERELEVYSTFAFVDAKDHSVDQSIRSYPSYISRFGASYAVFGDSLTISPDLGLYSSTRSGSGYRFESYALANLTILSTLGFDDFRMAATVYNIFDKEFVEIVNPNEGSTGERSLEAGRQLRLQVSWLF